MKKYTDQGKVDTRSGFGAGGVPRAVKRGISYGSVIFLLLMTASCTRDCKLSQDREKLSWAVEYALNGEIMKDTGYTIYSPIIEYPALVELQSALWFWLDEDFFQQNSTHLPMNILMQTPDLFFLFTDDDESRFLVNHSYRFNERCIAMYTAGESSLYDYMEYEILDGSYSFEVKQGSKDSAIIVYFEVDEIITGLPEWYEGPLSVGDRITIKNGRLVQYGLGTFYIDNTFEL